MPLREAALLGCAIPTGVGAVLNTAQVQPGSSVAVFGLGGVGMSAVLASSLVPDTTFIAIDIVDRKLELARQLGAAHLVNALRENPVEAVVEITGGQGADYAIEAAGTRQTMEAAFESVRRGGGLCVLAGNLPYGGRINIDPFDLICGKRIVGTWGGDSEPDRDIPTYVDLYLNGKLRLEPLITHEHALQDINLTLDAIDAGEIGRGVINLNL
jgi:S-(hydroxymethyl)glutathione dehydrogenase/alcohol dehydrogenase